MGSLPSAGSLSALIPFLAILGMVLGPLGLFVMSPWGRAAMHRNLGALHTYFYGSEVKHHDLPPQELEKPKNQVQLGQGTAVSATQPEIKEPKRTPNPEVENFDFSIFEEKEKPS